MFRIPDALDYLRHSLLRYRQYLVMKRFRADEDSSPPATAKKARVDEGTHVSSAAKFNDMVLRKLQRAFAANPEDDLLAKFPTEYSTRLAGRKKQDEGR